MVGQMTLLWVGAVGMSVNTLFLLVHHVAWQHQLIPVLSAFASVDFSLSSSCTLILLEVLDQTI